MTTATPSAQSSPAAVEPELKRGGEQVALALFIGIPFLEEDA